MKQKKIVSQYMLIDKDWVFDQVSNRTSNIHYNYLKKFNGDNNNKGNDTTIQTLF